MVAITFLALGLAAIASAAPAKTVAMPPHSTGVPALGASHLPLADITWIGQLHHGGPNVSFTGKHTDVMAKIIASKPHWLADNVTHTDAFSLDLLNATHPDSLSLEKRSNRVSQACWQSIFMQMSKYGANAANCVAIINGLNYMTRTFGDSMCQVPARACGRFSCSYDSSTLMCNDNNFPVTIPCKTMIQNFYFVFNTCSLSAEQLVEGQAFYINPSYNVLIKHTDANKHC
jgi:hypothetical protein